jgi:HD superfamily phosphohydrolase
MKRFANGLVSSTAGYLPKALQPDEGVVRDLVVAALCHDLGHGPLSHAWEQRVMGGFDKEEWLRALGVPADAEERYPWLSGSGWDWHEVVTQGLLLGGGELQGMLEAVEAGMSERVAALLAGQFFFPYLAGAFSSDVDADRCDFILRDATQTGVSHGRYDLDWLVSTIAVGEADGRPVLGFDAQKAPRVIEQLLIARRALYDIVYQHSAARAAEGMVGLLLARAHELASRQPETPLVEGFDVLWTAISGRPLSAAQFLELDEDALWIFIRRLAQTQDPDTSIPRLADMLLHRQLFKPLRLTAEQIARLALDPPDSEPDADGLAWNKIDRILLRHGFDPPDHFRFLDDAKFTFFHERPPGEGSWLIDQSGPGQRRATPVRTELSLVHHTASRKTTRLFVPAVAVHDLANAWASI